METTTTIEEQILERLRKLPEEKQREVLRQVQELVDEPIGTRPRGKSVRGLWADLDFDVTEEDIAQARREMWGNFPRDPFE